MHFIDLKHFIDLMHIVDVMHFADLMHVVDLMHFVDLMHVMDLMPFMDLMDFIDLMNFIDFMERKKTRFVFCVPDLRFSRMRFAFGVQRATDLGERPTLSTWYSVFCTFLNEKLCKPLPHLNAFRWKKFHITYEEIKASVAEACVLFTRFV